MHGIELNIPILVYNIYTLYIRNKCVDNGRVRLENVLMKYVQLENKLIYMYMNKPNEI